MSNIKPGYERPLRQGPIFRNQSTAFIGSMVFLGIFSPTVFLGLPGLMGMVAEHWHFGESGLGISVFSEILGMTLGTLGLAWVFASRPVKWSLTLAGLLGIVVNSLTPFSNDLISYSLFRFMAGISAGAISGLAMRYLSYTNNPGKHLGLLVMGQVVWSSSLLGFILPAAAETLGAQGAFFGVGAIFIFLLLPVVFFDKTEALAADVPPLGVKVHALGAYLVLFSLFALNVGVGSVWTFIERLGADAAIDPDLVSKVVGAANLMGVLACILVPRIGQGIQIYKWNLGMLLICALAVACLALPTTLYSFGLCVLAFVIAWTGSTILILATIPVYDPIGRYTAISIGFLGLGYGLGSSLSGFLLEANRVHAAIFFSSGACLAAFLFYASLRRSLRKLL